MQNLSQTPSIINSCVVMHPSSFSIVCPGLSIGICVPSEQCFSARFIPSRVMCLRFLCLQLFAQFSFRWLGFVTFLFRSSQLFAHCRGSDATVIPQRPEQQQREDHYSAMHCYRPPYVLAWALASRMAFAMMMLGQQALGLARLRLRWYRGFGPSRRSCRILVCRSSCPLWKNT